MPCTYCHKRGHNRKTCEEYLTTLSSGECCPNCENSFNDTPFAMLNCGHPTCLSCVMNMGSANNNNCINCAQDVKTGVNTIETIELGSSGEFSLSSSPPDSPDKSQHMIEVNRHGVMYCKRTNTYVYNRVRFNTLRAAINCRKAHLILGNSTTSMGKGVYIYNENSYNSLEMLRRAQTQDIMEYINSETQITYEINETL
jgi:hypothetical protein